MKTPREQLLEQALIESTKRELSYHISLINEKSNNIKLDSIGAVEHINNIRKEFELPLIPMMKYLTQKSVFSDEVEFDEYINNCRYKIHN